MEWGLFTFATARGLPPAELAAEAERTGFASLWFAEHSHIPLSRRSEWPGGDTLPRHYYEAFDPIVAMTAAAQSTTTLRVGTGVALLVQRDPIQFAKEIATLDVLSGGRVDVGVGAGWNLEELANHGTDPRTRWKLLRERVEAVKALWTMEAAEYHGDLVDFDPVAAWPKPVQHPHPPIHVGGGFPHGMRRAVRYGDGWMPILGRGGPDPADCMTALHAAVAAAGRPAGAVEFTGYGAPRDADALVRLARAGMTRALYFVRPGEEADDIAELVDQRNRYLLALSMTQG